MELNAPTTRHYAVQRGLSGARQVWADKRDEFASPHSTPSVAHRRRRRAYNVSSLIASECCTASARAASGEQERCWSPRRHGRSTSHTGQNRCSAEVACFVPKTG